MRNRRIHVPCPIPLCCVLFSLFVFAPDIVMAGEGSESNADSLFERITELRCEGQYAEALEVARALRDVLERDPTAKAWKVQDAGSLIATLEFVAGLSKEARRELAEADRLTADIEEHLVKAEYKRGLDLAERQLGIRSRHLGEGHPDVAESLENLASLLMKTGKYEDARPLFERALAIWESSFGTEHPCVATGLNGLASLLYSTGDHAGARPLFERALKMRENALGPEHPDVAQSLTGLARILHRTGKYTTAQSMHERALGIREKALGPEHPEVGQSLNYLASLHARTGDYTGARPLYERALAIWESSLGPEHPWVATGLNGLGNVLYRRADYAGARPLLERALEIRENALGPEHPDVAASLNDLALVLYRTGDNAGARPLLERALETWEKALGPEHPFVSIALNNLGLVLQEVKDYEGARPLYERALKVKEKVFGPDHPGVAFALNNLGLVLQELKDYEGARPLFERALKIKEMALGPEHPRVALGLNNLARLLAETGDYEGARPLFERALKIRERALGLEHPFVALSLQRLARLHWSTDDIAAAEPLLSRAATVFDVARLRAGTGLARATFQSSPYEELAATCLELGKTDQAWPSAEKALARLLVDLLVASDRRSLSHSEAAREDSLKTMLSDLGSQLVALQKASQADTTGDATKDLEETRLRLLDAEAAWSVFQRGISAKYPITEGQAFELERVQAALPKETAIVGWLHTKIGIKEFVSWGYVIRDSGPVSWVRLGQSPPTTGGSSPEERVPPGQASQNADSLHSVKKATDFRKALAIAASWEERVEDVNEINSHAMDVWAEWVAPLAPHLDGVKSLIVIPSGPMLGVPIEALVNSEGAYIGESYTISYAPSATIHTWLREQGEGRKAPPGRTALLVGDPPFTAEHLAAMEREEEVGEVALALTESFPEAATLRSALLGNKEALSSLPRLPWTREEVERAASVMPEGTVLLGAKASEQELLRLAESGTLRGFDTIHLATHALVDDEAPERSALILSRANLSDAIGAVKAGRRVLDGLLTAKEIVQQWELDADLVTLSGCQTGLGREVAGEGYVGLAHAFLQAGARSLVVSLWRVEDKATALLMGRFYENLVGAYGDERRGWRGAPMPKAEALREAKHWLRTYTDSDGSQPFRHPVYWSGFVLIGDPG